MSSRKVQNKVSRDQGASRHRVGRLMPHPYWDDLADGNLLFFRHMSVICFKSVNGMHFGAIKSLDVKFHTKEPH